VAEDLSTYTDVVGSVTAPTASDGQVWDSTTFLNKVYVTNGIDDTYFYPKTGNVWDEFVDKPIGRTIASFTSRLFLGDVTETVGSTTTRTPTRVFWSGINLPDNYVDKGANHFELDETPGNVIKLKPLVEQSDSLVGVLVAYKTQGIYHISATGDADSPFSRKLMDSSAGCIARGTVVGVSDKNGRDSHVFLGRVGGTTTVMRWNGAQIEQFGNDITPLLRDLGDTVNLEKSLAVVDTFGNYIMMFPTSDSTYSKFALVYNFENEVWTTWNLKAVTALGIWPTSTGLPITVLGRPDSFTSPSVWLGRRIPFHLPKPNRHRWDSSSIAVQPFHLF